jgi:pimeloyl-ACP methyl ester carboxylesterase
MTDTSRQYTLATSHGSIAVEETGHGDLTILLIHGNSSCRGVFRNQMKGPLARKHRLIAFDLPGHGQSSDAPDPSRSYTRPGFADAAIEILNMLGVADVVVFGWSLGGHIALEMAPRLHGIRGLMISGTPPVGRSNMADGFIPAPHMKLAGQQHLTTSDVDAFGKAIFGTRFAPFLRQAIERADGLARKTMFEAARSGAGVDQRWVVENIPIPLAVVNGSEDPFVNLGYLDTFEYANLWEGRCRRLLGLKHAPFWEAPGIFDPILGRFLHDISTGQAAPASVRAKKNRLTPPARTETWPEPIVENHCSSLLFG